VNAPWDQRPRGPLAGVRVLEIGGIGAAPYGCMMLADMGADIIRVERPAGGPLASPPNDPQLRSRRSIALDLKDPRAVEILMKLVVRSDVLVEAHRPGVAERLGFGPDACLAANPRLVYARLTGYGQTGPMARAAGHEINYLAMSGLLHQIGTADGTPVLPLNVVGDFGGGGLLMAFGVLCAYIESQRSGRGQVVDAAMVDGATSFLSMALGQMAAGLWRDAPGVNWLSGRSHCYDTYRTSDGRWVAVGALEPQFHRVLLERLGLDYAEFQAGEFRMDGARYDELIEEIWPRLKPRVATAFAARTQAEVLALFEGTDACVTPVLSIAEAQQHPHHLGRGTYVSVGGQLQNAPTPRFSRSRPAAPVPAPEIGEHTAAVLAELGYSEEEIGVLVAARAVATKDS